MPPFSLDATDWKILTALQDDARIANIELARRVHLSPSPCLARVRRLERSGPISRYVTLLDPVALGLTVSVFIQVRLEKQVKYKTALPLAPDVPLGAASSRNSRSRLPRRGEERARR